ncbi:MAG: adenosylcobalamin-dependent ribonucleoside-diphosphate reductase [Hyphomicrobiaceae bacterium]
MYPHPFDQAEIAREIWDQKYRLKAADGTPLEASMDETWWRVARAAAAAEKGGKRVRDRWAKRFHAILSDFTFLPAGRIIAGAGTDRRVTLFNCFVMGRIDDDLSSIFDNVREAALTMQRGGGIGHDFSTLRPAGAPVQSTGADASGPVSFMDVWDAMCRTIMAAGSRRGAMMATLRCDHPDIEMFIDAKADPARLRNFNLSVLVTDAFIEAVRKDAAWPLTFEGKVYRTVSARALWDRLMRATYDYAEPGVIFIDRINDLNNLAYCEHIGATNPCGEQPLPPYGACLLGSINLARMIDRPFEPGADIDAAMLSERVELAVRLLDNCIDVSSYPLKAQQQEARAKRRIGLGVTGLADALIFVGLNYGSAAAVRKAEDWMRQIEHAAYLASASLAAEKGSFPLYDAARFATRPNVRRLASDVQSAIARYGIRNGCLTSIAPTGTISLLAGNVSSGIEPVFDFEYQRRLRRSDGRLETERVSDFAYALYRARHPGTALPDAFVTANALPPTAHIEMQAALQRHVDSSISKTINCPVDMPFPAFKDIYISAYDKGLKGCTTFRPNPITGSILSAAPTTEDADKPAAPATAALSEPPQPDLPATAPIAAPTAPAARNARGDIVYMSRPLERAPALAGFTYKLRWPGSDNAIYVTINDIERDGRRRPFEIFINTKNLEHYAWTVALTRMISAVFRRGGDVTFVVEELKAIFDPQGGHWINGRYVPSLLAAIGGVIEAHMLRIGFLRPGERVAEDAADDEVLPSSAFAQAPSVGAAASPHPQPAEMNEFAEGRPDPGTAPGRLAVTSARRLCPRCTQPGLVREEGCWVCKSCGYSRCQ